MGKAIYIEKTDIHATLTTWIYCAMWQLWAAEQQGDNGYINWPHDGFLQSYYDKRKFSNTPNAYHWYFFQPKVHDILGMSPIRIDTWIWEHWKDISPVPFMAQPLEVIREYYQRNLIFNYEANTRGQLLVDKYNIDFTKTIGITWRGTDARTDGRIRLPIEKYFKWIDYCLERCPDARIMCTAEEDKILDPLLARYPQALKIAEFYQSPLNGEQNPERFSPLSGYERGLQPVLMVWLFSKCAYYIKNRSSTGAVASWMNKNGLIINLAHAETLSYEKLDDKVEIKGVRYDLE